jgi:phosphatidate cytidylyltransferase
MTSGSWSDLQTRAISGVAMVAVGLLAVWLGGHVFHVFIAAVCGVMIWELVRMLSPETPDVAIQLAAISGVALLAAIYLPYQFVYPVLIAPVLVGFSQLNKHFWVFVLYALAVMLAGYEMMYVRDTFGFVWLLWLVVGVVFMLWQNTGIVLILLSIVTAFAAQMGDIAESAIKRKMGVKDSSDLIPGHGGVSDRFDAMLGASVFLLLATSVIQFPPVVG